MMGWRSLSKVDDRIVLWRNTIQLFHSYTNFEGPFKGAGFEKYIVDMLYLTTDGDEVNPDLLTSNDDGWAIIELTISPNFKKYTLDKYMRADSGCSNIYGLKVHATPPEGIIARLQSVNDGPYCNIIVKDILRVENCSNIKNQALATKLQNAEGTDLTKLPQLPITLLPEMQGKTGEVRRGLVDIVMQIFDIESDGKTSLQMVDEGLERLHNVVNIKKKKSLINQVERDMDILIKKHLKDYLEFKDGKYMPTSKFTTHHKTLETIANELKEWAGSPQTTLSDY